MYGKHRKQVAEGGATEHEELGHMLEEATEIMTHDSEAEAVIAQESAAEAEVSNGNKN